MHSVLRTALRDLGATLARVAAYCAFLGAMGLGVKELVAALPTDPTGASPEPRLQWVQTVDPAPAFALDMADFLGANPHYALWRHPGGGRRDRLTWAPQAGRSFAIELYRPGAEAETAEDEPMGQAAQHPRPTPLASKFGPFALKPAPDAGASCIAFGRNFDEPRLQIVGLYCGSDAHARARVLIACSLDRLTLVSAGGDAALAGLFAHADVKRSRCGPGRLPAVAMPRRAEWLEGAAGPRLRGAMPSD